MSAPALPPLVKSPVVNGHGDWTLAHMPLRSRTAKKKLGKSI